MFKKITTLLFFIFASTSNAAVMHFEYKYDGVNYSTINGSNSIFGTMLNVGDTINLSIIASGNSYWDVSKLGFEFAGNIGIGRVMATRGSSGFYSLSNNGITLRHSFFSISEQSNIHLGPNYIDFSGLSFIDKWNLSLTLDSTDVSDNEIVSLWNSASWNIFGLENNPNVTFVRDIPSEKVSTPSSFVLFGLALLVFASSRRKSLI